MSNTKQELFENQRDQYGCGYWNSCWEHACPCRISMEDTGLYDEKIDKSLKDEARKVADDLEKELSDADFYELLYESDSDDGGDGYPI